MAIRTRLLTGLVLGSLSLIGMGQPQLIRIALPSHQALVRQFIAPPRDFVELCTGVQARRALTWQFEADAPVEFGTHFHQKDAVVFPESMTAMSAAKGRLVPGSSQDYCWMWTNSTAVPVIIRVQFGP